MYSLSGLAKANDCIVDLMEELAGMGVLIPQLHKEYGPGQYEASIQHGTPIEAVDRYLKFRAALHDIAGKYGMVATLMPKPFADWAGNSLHVHLSIWDADGRQDLTASDEDDISLSQIGDVVHGRAPRACAGIDRGRFTDGQQLQAALARIVGPGQHLLGRRQQVGCRSDPGGRIAAPYRVPLAG